MSRRALLTRERLDGRVVDIEFVLIAVIQGLALTTLAVESETVIGETQWLYWPYVIAGENLAWLPNWDWNLDSSGSLHCIDQAMLISSSASEAGRHIDRGG